MRTATGRRLRQDARDRGIPLMSLKGNTYSHCVGALRMVMGFEPAPGLASVADPRHASLSDPNYGNPSAVAQVLKDA